MEKLVFPFSYWAYRNALLKWNEADAHNSISNSMLFYLSHSSQHFLDIMADQLEVSKASIRWGQQFWEKLMIWQIHA
jgi:hypothetical protein